ncbi:hypothetical protein BDV19DRAFT_372130 [Aspergillus venezuelensis]
MGEVVKLRRPPHEGDDMGRGSDTQTRESMLVSLSDPNNGTSCPAACFTANGFDALMRSGCRQHGSQR